MCVCVCVCVCDILAELAIRWCAGLILEEQCWHQTKRMISHTVVIIAIVPHGAQDPLP